MLVPDARRKLRVHVDKGWIFLPEWINMWRHLMSTPRLWVTSRMIQIEKPIEQEGTLSKLLECILKGCTR